MCQNANDLTKYRYYTSNTRPFATNVQNGHRDTAQSTARSLLRDWPRNEVILLPTTPVEEQLAECIANLLELKHVGVDENFFMLGGHSLLAAQIVVFVADTFGVDLS